METRRGSYLVACSRQGEVKDTAHSNVVSVFISGEVSGDLQALLIEALKRQAVGSGLKLELWRWGAIAADAGATLLGNTISMVLLDH